MGLFSPEMFEALSPDTHFETNSEFCDPYDCQDPSSYIDMAGTLGRYAEKGSRERLNEIKLSPKKRMGVDEAVAASVQQLGSIEICSKLLSNIVLVGGSASFPYLNKSLEEM